MITNEAYQAFKIILLNRTLAAAEEAHENNSHNMCQFMINLSADHIYDLLQSGLTIEAVSQLLDELNGKVAS